MVHALRSGYGPQAGDKILSVGKSYRHYLPDEELEDLVGATFQIYAGHVTWRKAKYLLFHTDRGLVLCHNKFTGYWDMLDAPWSFDYVEYARPQVDTKSIRVSLLLETAGSRFRTFQFHDFRTLGEVRFYKDVHDPARIDRLAKMGSDIVDTDTLHPLMSGIRNPYELSYWANTLRSTKFGKHTTVKHALLDQHLIAGLGNIAVCEVLHVARIHPASLAMDANLRTWIMLLQAAQEYVATAITHRVRYHDFLKVFRRSACGTCGGVMTRLEQENRGTYFCGRCQSLDCKGTAPAVLG